ncbi:sialic acid-binding Ig-like lectin 13 [Pleurodeles waltl]|uniref:sialic acid-binding Ig-like lectin 13 n=1 Tax=Pleurodeles waltl TaxID=8319 RepID=UPI0037097613
MEQHMGKVIPHAANLVDTGSQSSNPVNAHQKHEIWKAIAKKVWTLVVHKRHSLCCQKRWEVLRRATQLSSKMMRLHPKHSSDKYFQKSFTGQLHISSIIMDYKQGAFLCAVLQVFLCQPVLMQWSFSVPGEITALEGSCLVIPCTFTGSIPGSDRPPAFTWCLWIRNWYPVVYSKDSPNVLPRYEGRTRLVGDLEDHNCTLQINHVTREDADTYYALIERKYYLGISVKVSNTPAQPTVTDPGTMSEGLPVTITCSVEHTCPAQPPTLAWDKIMSNGRVYHEELSEGRWRTVLLLNYTPAAEHHMEDFVCSATYPSGKTTTQSIRLSIRYAPKNTTAAEEYHGKTIKEGDTVTLWCFSQGNPIANTYRWFEGPHKTPILGYAATFTVKNISWDGGPYVCTAENDLGTGESPLLHLNIQHAPKGVDAVLVEDPEEGNPMELSCATKSSNPRETHFTWYKNENVIQEGKTLKIESTAMDDAGVYHCMAQNAIGNTSSAPVTVKVKPARSNSTFPVLGGVAAAIFLILLLLVIFIIIRVKKKKAPMLVKENPPPAATEYERHVENQEEIPMNEHLYGNIDDYIHVRGRNERGPMQEYPELIDPKCNDVEESYSQLPGRQQEEQVSEELNYATILHFESSETAPTPSTGEEIVEYATVRR